MDKKQLEAELSEKKKELEAARKHYNEEEDSKAGPYAEVEYKEEIRRLEIEVSSLENKLKDL
ncbi:hypothetical protein SAMN04488102_10537 [Alkalibacterium subtropicum]|uniref:Uncharacterized protein n=1 Tax=Alkalibacterium subtropicum TaxID=753702 RepID=A0A1I1IBD7_9LACT|nr:hypothetical protein [Alkalibacterium subtropicum]SFC33484.1 hypothetical protein SAMN04488102_10537 [Alkalibacterium subtropicum]